MQNNFTNEKINGFLENYLERRKKGILGPKPNQHLIFLIEDVHLSEIENFDMFRSILEQ